MNNKKRRERGTGSIYKRGNAHVVQVCDGYKDDGKPNYRQMRCKSQSDAVRVLNEFNALLTSGKGIPEKTVHTVSSWLDAWLEDHIKPNREDKTHAVTTAGREFVGLDGYVDLSS